MTDRAPKMRWPWPLLLLITALAPNGALALELVAPETHVGASTPAPQIRTGLTTDSRPELRQRYLVFCCKTASDVSVECNLYSYAGNDPVNFVDPTGEAAKDAIAGFSIGFFNGIGMMLNAAFNARDCHDNPMTGVEFRPCEGVWSDNPGDDADFRGGVAAGKVVGTLGTFFLGKPRRNPKPREVISGETTWQGGAARAAVHGEGWASGSLRSAVEKFAPGSTGVRSGRKSVYLNEDSGIQVVHDIDGNYFRIENTSLNGRRRYLDMDGNVPNNKTIDGRQMGRTQAEYNQATHFRNAD